MTQDDIAAFREARNEHLKILFEIFIGSRAINSAEALAAFKRGVANLDEGILQLTEPPSDTARK